MHNDGFCFHWYAAYKVCYLRTLDIVKMRYLAFSVLLAQDNHNNASKWATPLITSFMRPTWGPSGTDRTQVGLMLAPWTLLSRAACVLVQLNYRYAVLLNTLRPREFGHHIADNNFKYSSWQKMGCFFIQISRNLVNGCPVHNRQILLRIIIAHHQTGGEPLSEQMMTFLTYAYHKRHSASICQNFSIRKF